MTRQKPQRLKWVQEKPRVAWLETAGTDNSLEESLLERGEGRCGTWKGKSG